VALRSNETIIVGIKAYSLDEKNAKRLWKLSEEMTGIKFDL
jgi:hypothetical protein